jgi:hypothetical protein
LNADGLGAETGVDEGRVVVGEFAAMMPRAGGQYVSLSEAFWCPDGLAHLVHAAGTGDQAEVTWRPKGAQMLGFTTNTPCELSG